MFENIDKNNDSVGREFYLELASKFEEMLNKSKTFGEVTLMGDFIELLNSKVKMN